jgi:hypothetical protein
MGVCQYTRPIVPHPSYFNNPLLVGAFSCVLHQPDALRDLARLCQPIKKATKPSRVDHSPTPDCHDQHVNARERTITSLYGYAGKVGFLRLKWSST